MLTNVPDDSFLKYYQSDLYLVKYKNNKNKSFLDEGIKCLSFLLTVPELKKIKEIWEKLAELYYYGKEPEKIEVLCKKYELKSDFPWGYYYAGMGYFNTQKYEDALRIFTIFPEVSDFTFLTQIYSAKCYLKLNKLKEAETIIDKLYNCKYYNDNERANILRIKTYLCGQKHDYKKGIKFYKESLELCKDDDEFLMREMVFHNLLRENNDAIAKGEKYILESKDKETFKPKAYLLLASIYRGKLLDDSLSKELKEEYVQRHDELIKKYYEEEFFPEDSEYYREIALSCQQIEGNTDKAMENIDLSLKKNPKDTPSSFLKVQLLRIQGKEEEASKLQREIIGQISPYKPKEYCETKDPSDTVSTDTVSIDDKKIQRIKEGKFSIIKIIRGQAVKKYNCSDGGFLPELERRTNGLKKISDSHLLPFTYDKGEKGIIMEWQKGSDLGKYLADNIGLEVSKKKHILKEILLGLNALHKKSKGHLNLKPTNILIVPSDSENPSVILTDYSIFDALSKIPDFLNQSLPYLPVDALEKSTNFKAFDLFSFALVSYQIITEKEPYKNMTPQEIIEDFTEKGYKGFYFDLLESSYGEYGEIVKHIPSFFEEVKDVEEVLKMIEP